MNAAEYIGRQRKRSLTIGLVALVVLILLVLVLLLLWRMNREATDASIPEPGTKTLPPDNYPDLEAHAVTMAGYDLSAEGKPFILLSDPADNAIAGESHNFTPTPTRLPLVNDGRRWFIDYPGKSIGCIYHTLIIRESSREAKELPDNWVQTDLPDLSQKAIEEWGINYCAPTAAANVAWMLGRRLPALDPGKVFGLPENADLSLRANMLVGGEKDPIPDADSLAGLMNTKKEKGTDIGGIMTGFEKYLVKNDSGEWTLNDPELLKPMPLLDILRSESVNGSGIIFLLRWGNPEMENVENRGSMLAVLERHAEQPDTPEQQQTESRKPVTSEEMREGDGELELAEVIAGGGGEPGGGVNDFGLIKEDIMERLKDVKAGSGDIQLSLAWNNYNDLDLSCTEPDGTVIDFEHRRSPSGGNLDVDMNATPQSKRPVENIFWPLGQARRGKYQVHANYYRRHTSSREKIEFTLRVVLGKKEQFFKAKLPPKSGRVLIHTFEYK